jgi:hypothetical protein
MPEKANSNAVVIAAVAHVLGPFLLVMSLLLALRTWQPQLTCRVEDTHYRRAVPSFDGRYASSLDASRRFLSEGSTLAVKTAEDLAHFYESGPSPRGFLAGAQLRSRHLEVAHLVSENERACSCLVVVTRGPVGHVL